MGTEYRFVGQHKYQLLTTKSTEMQISLHTTYMIPAKKKKACLKCSKKKKLNYKKFLIKVDINKSYYKYHIYEQQDAS